MSATDELRRMLDERGVDWADGDASHTTEWTNANGQRCSAMYWKPTFSVLISGCTPEQAIAATLGERTCKPVEKDGVMRCSVCDYPLGIMSVPAYCAGCGAKVIEEEQ